MTRAAAAAAAYRARHDSHGSSPSSISRSSNSKQELKARLQAMRYSVEEKQRHVSNLFFGNDNDDNGRLVFSIFDIADSESEADISLSGSSCISFQSSRSGGIKQQQQPTSLLGAFRHRSEHEDTRRTVSPTSTSSSPTSSQSQSHSSTTRDSSSSSSSPDDVESGCIEFYTDRSEEQGDVQSTDTMTTTPIVEVLLGSRTGNNNNNNSKHNHMDDSSEQQRKLEQQKRKLQQQQQPQQQTRNLRVDVPTQQPPHQQQEQQQYGKVAKSNRKSLILSCCRGGGNDHTNSDRNDMPYYEEHLGEGRQYWRDIILGVNDGLVSTFLLIAGVVGANLSSTDILLTALSGTIAGAISMSAGEYVATKTQQEVMDGEIALERKHIAKNRDFELLELKETFGIIGIPEDDNSEEVVNLRRHLMNYYAKNDEAHVKVHAVLELGVVEDEKRNPFIAGGVAFFLFFFGAMPSVIPFLCTSNIESAFLAAAICTTTGLLLVGAIKTWATRGSLLVASLENLLIAAGGGGIAYGVGLGFEKLVKG